jgi:hypothetical protein
VELAIVLSFSLLALILGGAAFVFSVWNFIQIQAQKNSTHTVIPIGANTTMDKVETELEKIIKSAGGNQNDLNRDLFKVGIDPEDLV